MQGKQSPVADPATSGVLTLDVHLLPNGSQQVVIARLDGVAVDAWTAEPVRR